MKYKVLKDFKGSPDGCAVVQYLKDQEVEMVDSLAEVALAEKWVKPIKEEAASKKSSGGGKASSPVSDSEE